MNQAKVKKGFGLLSFALRRSGKQQTGHLNDSNGKFAYRLKDGILTARQYIYGNIVSAHKRAVISALNNKVPLIMYISNQDKFYQFNPETLLKESEENIRGDEIMLNFNIKLGKRWL